MSSHRVFFRHRPHRSVKGIDLRGDMFHWREPVEMRRTASSEAWETCLELPPGAYGYKFSLADGEWELDAHNPRTRSWLGARNSLLVVDGAEEPLLHAPCLPWVFVGDDGRVCVRAGVRKGAAEELALMVDDGSGWVTLRMRQVGSEDEHELYEAWFPVRSDEFDYLFALPDGSVVGASGGPGLAFRGELSRVRRGCPQWWRDAVVYSIFMDRYRALDGLIEDLPRLAGLGVSTLLLTPIALAASSDRHEVIDPQQVDPALGGDEAFRRLIGEAHARGLRIIADLPLTRVHPDFFPFRDVREKGPASQYWDWFRFPRHPFGIVPGPGYHQDKKEEPLLDLHNAGLQDYLVQTVEQWATRGLDGVRFDAAESLPPPLVKRLSRAATALNPQSVLLAGLQVDNGYRWLGAGLTAATDQGVLDVVHDLLWEQSIPASEAARRLSRMRFLRGGPGWSSIAFSTTRAQPRLKTMEWDRRRNQLGHLMVLMGAAIPLSHPNGDEGMGEWFRRALQLRNSSVALRHGDEVFFAPENGGAGLLVLRRVHPAERIDVLIHAGEGEVRYPAPPCPGSLMLEVGDVRAELGAFVIGPWSGAVVGCVK